MYEILSNNRRACLMKDKARISLFLTLLGGVLPVFIWWLLFTRTALLLFYFRWPDHLVSASQGNLETLQITLKQLVFFGGLAFLLPVMAVIVGHLAQRQANNKQGAYQGYPVLILAYCFALITFVLLCGTLCGDWLSTFFDFY
jgi:hypothetical protein